MNKLAPYRKAIVGGLVALLTALSAALADGAVSPVEVIGAVLAALVGSGLTYAVPNATQPDSEPEAPEVDQVPAPEDFDLDREIQIAQDDTTPGRHEA